MTALVLAFCRSRRFTAPRVEPYLYGRGRRRELHSDYSLYFDLEHADGSFEFGYTLPFHATPEWQTVTGVLFPSKPVHILHIFCIFRYHRGVAHFDDVFVRPLVAQVCVPSLFPHLSTQR
jgi:hypothetical protein